jgi:hypothetical protein
LIFLGINLCYAKEFDLESNSRFVFGRNEKASEPCSCWDRNGRDEKGKKWSGVKGLSYHHGLQTNPTTYGCGDFKIKKRINTGTKIAQKNLGGSKLHNLKSRGTKIAFKQTI